MVNFLLHGSLLTLNELRLVELSKHLVTFLDFFHFVEVDRGLRHKHHPDELKNGRHCSYAKHPPPLVPECNADKVGDELTGCDAQDVAGDNYSTDLYWRSLTKIEGDHHGTYSDS